MRISYCLATLAALTVSPKRQPVGRYLRVHVHHFQAVDVASLVRALWRHLRGQVMLLWDRGALHQGSAIAALQQRYPRRHLEACPAYAPALNPVEQLWNHVNGHTANRLLRDRRELRRRLQANTRRVRRSQATRRSCILASKLPSPP